MKSIKIFQQEKGNQVIYIAFGKRRAKRFANMCGDRKRSHKIKRVMVGDKKTYHYKPTDTSLAKLIYSKLMS